jgi:hypothetical protein
MKTATKNGKARLNGRLYTRKELLAAHERAFKRLDRMTPEEGFATLVKAGICTPGGKLAPRYGGWQDIMAEVWHVQKSVKSSERVPNPVLRERRRRRR